MIEKSEVPLQAASDRGERLVRVEVDLLVFDGAPQAFDEHVVTPAAAPVHADLNPVRAEHSQKRRAGELRALIDTGFRQSSSRVATRATPRANCSGHFSIAPIRSRCRTLR